jgi:hypothetical protein
MVARLAVHRENFVNTIPLLNKRFPPRTRSSASSSACHVDAGLLAEPLRPLKP